MFVVLLAQLLHASLQALVFQACMPKEITQGVSSMSTGSISPPKLWLTVTEGAEYAGLCRDTIYTACERGELRHVRVGGRRAIRLRVEWIDAWLEQHARGHRGHGAERMP
jgi:excisionase family DNA binding protein